MLTPRSTLTRRVAGRARRVAVAHSRPARRMRQRPHTLLQQLRDRIGRTAAQYIDVERTATTPERFLRAVAATSPFPAGETATGSGARAAFDATLALLRPRRGPAAASRPRSCSTSSSSSGRSRAFPACGACSTSSSTALAASGNRFVLTSRYTARALRLLSDRSARFEVIHMPALTAEDTHGHARPGRRRHRRRATSTTPSTSARTVQALADGRPGLRPRDRRRAGRHARPRRPGATPISALAALLAPDGVSRGSALLLRAAPAPRARLRRAQGDSRDPGGRGRAHAHRDLAAAAAHAGLDEGLPLVARGRGSVTSRQKRYSFTDPLLRVWVRLHCRATAPDRRRPGARDPPLRAAAAAAAAPSRALAMVSAGPSGRGRERSWGIIEID